jgi:hypothetical protein
MDPSQQWLVWLESTSGCKRTSFFAMPTPTVSTIKKRYVSAIEAYHDLQLKQGDDHD